MMKSRMQKRSPEPGFVVTSDSGSPTALSEDTTAGSATPRIESTFTSRLKPKLDAIELVRSDLTVENIEVPGVVVIGDQSAGKSSVLESISGINFPRAENTCTRRPCILRMECDPHLAGEYLDSYAYVSNEADVGNGSDSKIRFEDIGNEINRLTRERAGPGSNIIADPIHVKVVRKSGPTLTLIDLPGITWVNDQQSDIHEIIVRMIQQYIKNEQMVILAVVSATADFGNSEAIKLAKEVDPTQSRTIGVVTKIDTIQKDSDIVKKLRAERDSDIRLNLGWVAVRCRTPTEVRDGLSAEELRQKEKTFFETHPLLTDLDQQFWGTSTLVDRVVDIQSETVDKWIPEVRAKIHDALFKKTQKLRDSSEVIDDDDVAKRMKYNKLVSQFLELFNSCVRGEYSGLRTAVSDSKELHIPPRLNEFYKLFKKIVSKETQDFLSPEFSPIVEEQDQENRGCSLPNFLSDPVFRTLFINEFEKVVPKSVCTLLKDIRDYMLKVLSKFISIVMNEFPRLPAAVTSEVHQLVQRSFLEVGELLHCTLESEKQLITLDEEGYENMLKQMEEVATYGREQSSNLFSFSVFGITQNQVLGIKNLQTEKPRVFRMQTSLAAYTKLVHNQLFDRVAKLCHLYFVTHLHQKLSECLLSKDSEFISNSMIQDQKLVMKRKNLQKSIDRLDNCLKVLDAL